MNLNPLNSIVSLRAGRATALLLASLAAGAAAADGLVGSIVKAPITPNGDVAGAPTDLTINLGIDPDPAVPGLSMKEGWTIEVALPEEFVFADREGHPVMDLFASPDCSFQRLACSTALLLHGWPQHPILPSFPPGERSAYEIRHDPERNSIALTAVRSLDDAPLPGPGIKQVHLMLLGYRNPVEAAEYEIDVAILDADGHRMQQGTGYATIRPSVAPSLSVTSIFDHNGAEPPNLNTIYQVTQPGNATPLPWDFLAWDADGDALDGLVVEQTSPSGGTLMRNGERIGAFTINAPEGAAGHRLEGGPSVALDSEPVFGTPIPTGHFTAQFTAGSEPGRYRTLLQLDGGDPITMIVDAAEPSQ